LTDIFSSGYGYLGALLLCGIVLGALPVILPLFIAPRTRGKKTTETYECGLETIGSAWVRFDIAYYLFALIFVVFEVDVLYILPVALIFDTPQYVWRDFIELFIFVGILFLAIIYAWRKGVLHWRS
jgi:NADH-quinone oxidoreductase subunit A